MLHSLAPFLCMYLLWQIETTYRARFSAWSRVHIALDNITNLLLLISAMNLSLVQSYRGQVNSTTLASVLIPLVANLGIWTLRTAEIAIFSARECARRHCANDLFIFLQIGALWGGALALVSADSSNMSEAASVEAHDWAAVLMWAGNFWWYLKSAQRPLLKLLVRGAHLPLEQSAVCTNTGFTTHRNNEFMFLMLGEAVLQIIVSEDKLPGSREATGIGDALFNEAVGTAAFAFLLTVSLMFSFRQMVVKQLSTYAAANEGVADVVKDQSRLLHSFHDTRHKREQEQAARRSQRTSRGSMIGRLRQNFSEKKNLLSIRDLAAHFREIREIMKASESSMAFETRAQRLLLVARVNNVISTFIWQVKAVGVMLVGVGVKLAIYDPMADPDSHFALEQRLGLGVAVALTFGIQFFNAVCMRNWHHYSLAGLCKHRLHAAILLCRLLLVTARIGVCYLRIVPYVLVAVQAGLGVIEASMLHMQEYRYPIKSNRKPYTADMPAALNSLRLKAQRARLNGVPRGLRGGRQVTAGRSLLAQRLSDMAYRVRRPSLQSSDLAVVTDAVKSRGPSLTCSSTVPRMRRPSLGTADLSVSRSADRSTEQRLRRPSLLCTPATVRTDSTQPVRQSVGCDDDGSNAVGQRVRRLSFLTSALGLSRRGAPGCLASDEALTAPTHAELAELSTVGTSYGPTYGTSFGGPRASCGTLEA